MNFENLPDNIDELKKIILKSAEEIQLLKDTILLLQRKKYAPSSEKNPNQRFGQILFNLAINQFKNSCNNENELRDIYNDSDEQILERINTRMKLFELQAKENINKNS